MKPTTIAHTRSTAYIRTEITPKSNGSSHSTNSYAPSSPTSKNTTSRDYNGMRREWMPLMLSVKSSPFRMAQHLALVLQHHLRHRCQPVVSHHLLDFHHHRAWADNQQPLHLTWALFLSSSTKARPLRRG